MLGVFRELFRVKHIKLRSTGKARLGARSYTIVLEDVRVIKWSGALTEHVLERVTT